MKQNKTSYLLGILALTTIATGILLSSNLVLADDSVVDEVSITVPVSCTMSAVGMNSHNAEIANGLYNSAIGETTLKAFCNDNEGFAIYAISYTDNEEGKDVLTNSTLGSTYDIETGTAITGNDSQWAMKLATTSSPTPTYPIVIAGSANDSLKEQGDPDFTSFQEVPNDYAKVAYRTSATDIGTNAEGATLTTTYQAYISRTQPAGTYTGQVKYTLVHPHDTEKPEKPLACNPYGTTISTIVCMQDVNSTNKTSILASMTEDAEYQLYDMRDEKQYYVAKLKDGNLWMTQNLDHSIVTDGSVIYDNTTTDLGWDPSTSSYGTASWIPSTATSSTIFEAVFYNTPESFDPGELYWNGIIASSNQIAHTGSLHYHLGNYYNWTAAIAMNDSVGVMQYANANQSICPSGWSLPTASSFQNLVEQYGWSSSTRMTEPVIWDTAIMIFPSGTVYSNSADSVGYNGYYWSPTYSDLDYGWADGLLLDGTSSALSPNAYSKSRSSGSSIRCLAR